MQCRYDWREFVRAGLVGLCVLTLSGPATAAERKQHPNVLITAPKELPRSFRSFHGAAACTARKQAMAHWLSRNPPSQ